MLLRIIYLVPIIVYFTFIFLIFTLNTNHRSHYPIIPNSKLDKHRC